MKYIKKNDKTKHKTTTKKLSLLGVPWDNSKEFSSPLGVKDVIEIANFYFQMKMFFLFSVCMEMQQITRR